MSTDNLEEMMIFFIESLRKMYTVHVGTTLFPLFIAVLGICYLNHDFNLSGCNHETLILLIPYLPASASARVLDVGAMS